MALRVNQAGTWRNITTQCVNQAGTWRRVVDGCVNQSSTWRCFGMTAPTVTSFTSTNIVRCVCNGSVSWTTSRASSVSTNFGATATSGTCAIASAGTYCVCAINSFATSATSCTTVSLVNPSLGTSMQGGNLICIASGTFWIVAPNASEVSRNWYSRNDANTRAQQVSGCTGWFVPTRIQLQNPGYTCRTFWDSFSSSRYWSSTERNSYSACNVVFTGGTADSDLKAIAFCVRAFRCVTY